MKKFLLFALLSLSSTMIVAEEFHTQEVTLTCTTNSDGSLHCNKPVPRQMTQKEINTSLIVSSIFVIMVLGSFICLGISWSKCDGHFRLKKPFKKP